MTMRWTLGMVVSVVCAAAPAWAQMHKVAKPEPVVRAVGVYEWTGDIVKPTASRLIPVTLFIDQKLEDAGLYLARPVPFALLAGNVYELDDAGVAKGNLELVYARHLQAASNAEAYDDGWFGYGSFKLPVVPKNTVARKVEAARTSGIESAGDAERPHFSNKAGQPVTPASVGGADAGKADETAKATDPDRPHFSKKGDAAPDAPAAGKNDAGAVPADDPDRPTMKRRSDTAAAADASIPASADDPDRPTLKRHAPETAARGSNEGGAASLNDDPDRPNLHRGKPTQALTEKELPKLAGLPVDLQQMVAVSDAASRPVHAFLRAWDDDAERAAILGKMRSLAAAQVAAYRASPAGVAAPATAGRVARSPNSKLRLPAAPVQALPSLEDEQVKGFLLSYGDVPTFVYQAHTVGTGVDLRYVTIVAQRDAQGEPKVVLASVTDATHLDRTARLRLVDAVDVEASNRASLLFEMRGQTSRQFALYRVLGWQAQQIFATGTTQ